MAGIYIHIPFCKQACHYCDFHFSTNLSLSKEIADGLAIELSLQKEYLGNEPIETIYFGGGTPSILTENALKKIMQSVEANYSLRDNIEFTIEANPEDLTKEKIDVLKTIGANRLSIGIQSFDDTILKFLNRSHNARQAEDAIQIARGAGFNNISIDLIYAIPGRSTLSLNNDLELLCEINPQHISAYSLTIEDKTVFGKRQAIKKFFPASDEDSAQQFELIIDKLTTSGYEHYEVSNYSKPGFISNHNSNYWRQKKYLGVGPSAHSYNGISRQANVSNNHTYLRAIKAGIIPATIETLTKADKINEYLMTSLRTSWGCDVNYLINFHQYDLLNQQGPSVNKNLEEGLMTLDNNILRLTRSGKLHADKLSSDLFLIP